MEAAATENFGYNGRLAVQLFQVSKALHFIDSYVGGEGQFSKASVCWEVG